MCNECKQTICQLMLYKTKLQQMEACLKKANKYASAPFEYLVYKMPDIRSEIQVKGTVPDVQKLMVAAVVQIKNAERLLNQEQKSEFEQVEREKLVEEARAEEEREKTLLG